MQQTEPESTAFDIAQARRVLREAFAPWVLDLGLSIERVDCDPPAAAEDWQPGAILRMAFSERLCRHGGVICGQALMALADTAMVIAMVAANRGYRPMTTVDHAFQARGDSIGRAGGCAGRSPRPHHEFRPRDAPVRRRREAGGDGFERLCDAVRARRIIVNRW